MTQPYPVLPGTTRRDRRYSIAREYCGYAQPYWVVRFCNDWVNCAATRPAALLIALAHQAEHYRNLGLSHLVPASNQTHGEQPHAQ